MGRGRHRPSSQSPTLCPGRCALPGGDSPGKEQRLPGPGRDSPLDEPLPDAEAHALQLGGAAPVLLQDTRRRSVSPGRCRAAPGGPGPTHPFALLGGAVQPRHHLAVQQQEQRLVRHRRGRRPFRAGRAPAGAPGRGRAVQQCRRAGSARRGSAGKGARALRLCRTRGIGRCRQPRLLRKGRSRGSNAPLLRTRPARPAAGARRSAPHCPQGSLVPCPPRGVTQRPRLRPGKSVG